MEKLIMQVKEPDPSGRGSCAVRISNGSAKSIRDLAHKTRQTDREIADALIEYALRHVELRPVDLYDLTLKEEAVPDGE
jgi:hypothetical protein